MPFWEQVRRCENCRKWKQADPNDAVGTCEHVPDRAPFWTQPTTHDTRFDEGKQCPAYEHQKRKPHPLDHSQAYLASAQVGDVLPMRTYGISDITSYAHAEVVRHNRVFVTVRMFNASYRIRRTDCDRQHGGTVIGMEQWGVDIAQPIKRAGVQREHPERAEGMLRGLHVGDLVPLLGYPPLDNLRRQAKVMALSAATLTLRVGRRKVRMYRKGPLAGLTIDDVWVLDTTGEDHAQQADQKDGSDAVAAGAQA